MCKCFSEIVGAVGWHLFVTPDNWCPLADAVSPHWPVCLPVMEPFHKPSFVSSSLLHKSFWEQRELRTFVRKRVREPGGWSLWSWWVSISTFESSGFTVAKNNGLHWQERPQLIGADGRWTWTRNYFCLSALQTHYVSAAARCTAADWAFLVERDMFIKCLCYLFCWLNPQM